MAESIERTKAEDVYSIAPKYLAEFRCVGSACRDTCCAGWRVTIDKSTYKKYQRVKDAPLRTLIEAHIKPVRSVDRSEGNFARIVMDKDGACPFLEESLCKIQKSAGEGMLSTTCATYPRVTNVVDGIYSNFLTPSCPEATRLMLDREDALDLDVVKMSVGAATRSSGGKRWGLSVDASKLLHTVFLELVRVRGFPVWQRLSAVVLFGHLVHDALQAPDGVRRAETLIGTVAGEQSLIGIVSAALGLPGNHKAQFEVFGGLWRANAHRFVGGSALQRSVVRDIADEGGSEPDQALRLESVTLERYLKGLSVLKEFYETNEHMMTNYLVNELARNSFPMDKGDASLWRECQSVASRYGILRFMLALRAERCGAAFGKAEFADTIVVFSKRLEHNASFSLTIKKCFEAAKIDEPARVLKLLRE